MTLHYHVTPITPDHQLERLKGRCLMVRFGRHDQLAIVQRIAASIAYDNGAFGAFTKAKKAHAAVAQGSGLSLDDFIRTTTDWKPYYEWIGPLLDCPTSWAIVPDVIGAGSQEQDALLREWPHGRDRAAPVFHMDEPTDRLLRLLDEWPRVCIGSTGEFWEIWKPGWTGVELNPLWEARMDELWGAISNRHTRTPYVHMLRGMALAGMRWPFASVDSSNVAQNHHLKGGPVAMVERLDAANTPPRYQAPKRSRQLDLLEGVA